jgi:hypothetical protein
MNTSILTASHYGVVRFGDLECEAVVLKGGERGYVRRQLAKLLGFHETHKGGRFARFLADFAPNSLSELDKTREPILLPSGRQTQFFPAGIIADLASAVVNSALTGTLHKARKGIVPNCMKIMHALATTGEVALIDEATGYQYHRAPDALQDLISKLTTTAPSTGCLAGSTRGTRRTHRTFLARSRSVGSTGRCCRRSCSTRFAVASASPTSTTNG